MHRGGLGLRDLCLAARALAFDVGALREHRVHVPAQAVEAVALTFDIEAGRFERSPRHFVGGFGFMRSARHLLDGGPGIIDACLARFGPRAKRFDALRELFEFPLANELTLVRARGPTGDHARLFDEDAIKRDDGAEGTLHHAQAGRHVLNDDDAPEQGVDKVLHTRVTTDELGRDANHPALLLQVQRVNMPDRIEREELGASLLPPLQRVDGLEGDVFVFHDDGMEALLQRRIDGDFEPGRDANLPGQQADNAIDLRRLAHAAGLILVHQRLAHDEHVAGAGSHAIMLGLHAAQCVEPALEVVEFAQVCVAGGFEFAHLVLYARQLFAGRFGFHAGCFDPGLAVAHS